MPRRRCPARARSRCSIAPPDVDAYLSELAARLRARFGSDLVGVYAGGSIAFDAYVPGRSDVDVAVVTGRRLALAEKEAVVADTRHDSLPCPARGLELVVYAAEAVVEPSADPGFELELNSGREMAFHAAFDESAATARHWYVIDRAILARHGRTILGPEASTVFADVPRELVLPALVESVLWFAEFEAPGSSAVLNACRALLYAAEGRWSPKVEAGRWALERLPDRELVGEAIRAHQTREPLDTARTKPFLARAEVELRRHLG